jgi:hypothetical protein
VESCGGGGLIGGGGKQANQKAGASWHALRYIFVTKITIVLTEYFRRTGGDDRQAGNDMIEL